MGPIEGDCPHGNYSPACKRCLRVGDLVMPTEGPWKGSMGTVVRVDGQSRISVEFDEGSRARSLAPRGVGFYDGRWLRKSI